MKIGNIQTMATDAYTVKKAYVGTVYEITYIEDHINNIFAVWGDEGEDYYFFSGTEVYHPLVVPTDAKYDTSYLRSHAENPLEKAMARLLMNT